MPYRKPKETIDLTGWLAPWEADVLRKQIARYEQLRTALEVLDSKLEVESSYEERGLEYVAFYRIPAGPWHKILGLIRG